MLDQYYSLVELYRKEANYKIITFPNKNKICYVFFSSQAIYNKPYDVAGIKKVILSDRYEWTNLSQNKAIVNNCSKQIFIRDIGKELYQRGINEKIDTLTKLVQFIKEETKNMDVYLVGSSSGGYASFIASQINNVKRIYSIGGLVYLGKKSTYVETIERYNVDKKFINAAPYINRNPWIMHIYGSNNEEDVMNATLIRELNLNKCALIPFKSNQHAPRPAGHILIKLLTCKDSIFKKINNYVSGKKYVSEFCFSIRFGGGLKYIFNYFKNKI